MGVSQRHRYIAEFKIADHTRIVAITDGVLKDDVARMAIIHSGEVSKYFGDKFKISKDTPYTLTVWDNNNLNQTGSAAGARKFLVWTLKTYKPLEIMASGYKTAYNQLSGIGAVNGFSIVFLYDATQTEIKKSSKAEAAKLLQNKPKLEATLDQFLTACHRVPGIGTVMADITLTVGMIRDYSKGAYKQVPVSTIVAGLAVIVYFVSPVDILPDVIPVAGFIDDVAAITFLCKSMHTDLQNYVAWRESNGLSSESIRDTIHKEVKNSNYKAPVKAKGLQAGKPRL